MKTIYVVSEILDDKVIVFPLTKGLTDRQFEKEAKARIQVLNVDNLPVEVGSKVTIGFSRGREIFNGFAALLFPIATGLAVLFASPYMIRFLHLPSVEISKFLLTLFCMAVSIFVVFKVSRDEHPIRKFRIKSII